MSPQSWLRWGHSSSGNHRDWESALGGAADVAGPCVARTWRIDVPAADVFSL